MFVELIEALRCPRDHAESPLIATATRTEARHIMEGTLGCPVCHAEFPIRDGEALFSDGGDRPREPPNAGRAMQLGAFLELTDARGFAILCGRWGAHAAEVRALSTTPLILINPPGGIDVQATGVIQVRGRVPLANRSARAAALDVVDDEPLLASLIAAVRPGGRVMGPTALALPAGVEELARDSEIWVAQKDAAPDEPAPRLVSLRRA